MSSSLSSTFSSSVPTTTSSWCYTSPFLENTNNDNTNKADDMVLIVLNSPAISSTRRHDTTATATDDAPIMLSVLFRKLWKASSFRICADGGANRLYDATVLQVANNHKGDVDAPAAAAAAVSHNNQYTPDVIRGDLDSLREDVRQYYQTVGTLIEQDDDQDTNDLDKSLQRVQTYLLANARQQGRNAQQKERPKQTTRVCVYGAFGGRFDQEMASIQALFKWSNVFHHELLLCDDDTCAFLLPAVIRNEIRLRYYGEDEHDYYCDEDRNEQQRLSLPTTASGQDDQQNEHDNDACQDESTTTTVGEGPTCGLIPIGHRCEFVRTSGLKWNLNGSVALEFGGMVSTSNRAMERVITVQASHPLVFTAEMRQVTTK